ncbi:hypothetical protein HPP92_010863 [Vanilla planifolia]|uniref:Uncharacterized protein n=1 Tax=Vanilla planifolia TaxID=51239 RepID=A0A835QUN6_VANPL|nr:hypothetical protein HPP92_010863 [Vanilla planifolia]
MDPLISEYGLTASQPTASRSEGRRHCRQFSPGSRRVRPSASSSSSFLPVSQAMALNWRVGASVVREVDGRGVRQACSPAGRRGGRSMVRLLQLALRCAGADQRSGRAWQRWLRQWRRCWSEEERMAIVGNERLRVRISYHSVLRSIGWGICAGNQTIGDLSDFNSEKENLFGDAFAF